MSIGLNDLNKKRKKPMTGSSAKGQKQTPQIPGHRKEPDSDSQSKMSRVYAKSRTVRPWSQKALHSTLNAPKKTARSRSRVKGSDAVMNEAWIRQLEEPPFWIEFQQNSFFMQLNAQLTRLEQNLSTIIKRPFKILESLWFNRESK